MVRIVNLIKFLIIGLALTLMLTACYPGRGGIYVGGENDYPPRHAQKDNMPPAHAPAYGRRAQERHRYRYYPDVSVYFDTGRGVYFYLDDGHWQMSVDLPQRLRVHLGEHVTIEMDDARPYTEYNMHRKKYPPGQYKKKHNDKKRGYEKWND